jgi:UDP-N-acetylglucosamine 1-carboxyvinyltransferase
VPTRKPTPMDKLLIRGGRHCTARWTDFRRQKCGLAGAVRHLLTAEPVTLRNVPRLQDVNTMLKLIRNMGVQVERGRMVPCG